VQKISTSLQVCRSVLVGLVILYLVFISHSVYSGLTPGRYRLGAEWSASACLSEALRMSAEGVCSIRTGLGPGWELFD
jgi:hypothetical protein